MEAHVREREGERRTANPIGNMQLPSREALPPSSLLVAFEQA